MLCIALASVHILPSIPLALMSPLFPTSRTLATRDLKHKFLSETLTMPGISED